MHSRETVDRVLALCVPGVTTRAVADLTGVPYSTIAYWRRGARRAGPDRCGPCPRCTDAALATSYPYLLGMYLGDGHISMGRRGTQFLSIYCADAWPGVMAEVDSAMGAALGTSVNHVHKQGCVQVKSCSKHWTCLFPQHGPGKKHTRAIVLEPWQQEIVDKHPGPFLRGLFHSDGCRITNWTVRTVAGSPRRYEYPRWFFANESDDILDLCAASLDRLAIAHRRPRRNTISVARRESVAIMDEVVGPKH